MRKLIVPLFFALIIFSQNKINAQDFSLVWGGSIEEPTDQLEWPNDITTDKDGNVLTTGVLWQNVAIDFDWNGNAVFNSDASSDDAFIAKYDTDGNYQWAKVIGSTGDDNAYGITTDGTGSIYVLGKFVGTVNFNSSGTSTLTATASTSDYFIVKYDANGNFIWVSQIASSTNASGFCDIDMNSNTIVVGADRQVHTLDASTGALINTISLIDGTFDYAEVYGVDIDATNTIYVTGSLKGHAEMNPQGASVVLTAVSYGGNTQDWFLAKYNSSLDLTWANNFGGGSDYSTAKRGFDVQANSTGDIYVTGLIGSECDFDPSVNDVILTSSAELDDDFFLAKYNSSGAYQWAFVTGSHWNSNDDQKIWNLDIAPNGNVLISGEFSGNDAAPPATQTNFNPLGTTDNRNSVGADNFVATYTPSGILERMINMGATAPNYEGHACFNGNETIYVTGRYQGVMDIDPSAVTNNLPEPTGNSNMYVIKYINAVPCPNVDDIADFTGCDSYTLPTITGTDLSGNEAYYTGANGTGTSYNAGTVINTSQTLYIYDDNGSCSDEESFVITINTTPNITDITDLTVCDSYTLPTPIAGSNLTSGVAYYSDAAHTNAITGNITTSQTVYIYDANGTCTDAQDFYVTINTSPDITDITDPTVCDSYTLPTPIAGSNLTGSVAYYSNASHTSAITGNITTSQTVYIYDANGTCSDSEDFYVTVNTTPNITDITDPTVCDSYTLPTPIVGSNLTGSVSYYSDASHTNSITGNITTSQTVYIYDANGTCTDDEDFYVTVNQSPSFAINSNDPASCSASDGYITLTGLNSNTNYLITYDDGNTQGPTTLTSDASGNVIINGLNAGSYTDFVVELLGCSTSDNTTVNLSDPNAPSIDAGNSQTICLGEGVILTATNPDGANISWTPIITDGQEFFPTDTTTYTVTANLSGCISSDQVTVNVKPLPQIDAGQNQSVCDGEGAILTAINPDGANISWLPTITDGQEFFITDTTVYTVMAELNGCISTDQVTVNVKLLPQVDAGQNQTICDGEGVTLTAINLDGASISWSPIITDGQEFAPIDTTMYTVTAELNGCVSSDHVTINVNPLPQVDAGQNQTVCENEQITLAATNPDGANLQWNGITDGTAFNQLVGTETYYVTATLNSCSSVDSVDVTVNANPTFTTSYADFCLGGNTTIGVNENLTSYVWTFNGNTISSDQTVSVSQAGTYYVTVTENNCSSNDSLTITETPATSINVTNIDSITCFGDANGSITGTLGYNASNYNVYITNANDTIYAIANMGNDININLNNLDTGIYTINTINNLGCENSETFIITQPNLLSLNPNVSNISCYGYTDGSIVLNTIGGTQPYNYNWDGTTGQENVNNLTSGTYSITVTDANNCTVSINKIDVNQPYSLEILNITQSDIICNGESNGAIQIDIEGGVSNYTIEWSNGDNSLNINNLEAGVYNVTVTDQNSCVQTQSFELSEPTQIVANDSIYYINSLGNIDVNTLGGVGAYSYDWSNGVLTTNNENLIGGEYTLTITDQNNCKAYFIFTIDVPLLIPTVITPNADGFNDTWHIQGIEAYNNIDIYILNRWGDKLYEFSGSGLEYSQTSIEWDGRWKGKELPLGTYVYILNIDGNNNKYNGTITIVR